MERDTIMQAVPSGNELRAAPAYRQKETAENLIRSILDALDAERREPDRWEAEHLAEALGWIVAKWYFASITASEKALAPPDERADPETWGRTDKTATKRILRDGLDYVAGMPAPNA
ncbi:hypothetical protein [Ralstonia syzygii]|uniref:hypothetical protein n=1 Tax=Ralstonia syzygii TaxID=28097 RepID=UPI00351982F7